MSVSILRFSIIDYPFASLAQTVLGVEELGSLHLRPDLVGIFWLDMMNKCRDELALHFDIFEGVYKKFANHMQQQLGLNHSKLGYQTPPTFRVHPVGARTASVPHRDRDYAKGSKFINVWVPLVNVSATNSLWVERDKDSELEPVQLNYGEALVFNGYDVLHGSVVNTSTMTRVSFDMRYYTE